MLFNPKMGLKASLRLIIDHRLAKWADSLLFFRFRIVLAVNMAYALHKRDIGLGYMNVLTPIFVQHGPELFNIVVGDVEVNHDSNSIGREVEHVDAMFSKFGHHLCS